MEWGEGHKLRQLNSSLKEGKSSSLNIRLKKISKILKL